MSTPRRWPKVLLLLPLLPFLAVAAFWIFAQLTATPVYPDAPTIPSAGNTPAAPWDAPTRQARDSLRHTMAAENIPGLSVAVMRGVELIWAEGFGYADLATRAPVRPETRFRLGTASTVFTAAAAGLLLEQGKLTTAAIPPLTTPITPPPPANAYQRCSTAAAAANSLAAAQPWTRASIAMESAAQQPFFSYMQTQVFTRLSLSQSGAESATEENPERIGEEGEDPPPFNLLRHLVFAPLGLAAPLPKAPGTPATLYEPGLGHNALPRYNLHETPQRSLSCLAGAIAFYSTPQEMLRFTAAVASGRFLTTHSSQSQQLLETLGKGFTGELNGQQLVFWVHDPQTRLSLALVANRGFDVAALGRHLYSIFTTVRAQASRIFSPSPKLPVSNCSPSWSTALLTIAMTSTFTPLACPKA